MGMTQTLKIDTPYPKLNMRFHEPPTVEPTDARNTIIMPVNEYQSILPLKGKYAKVSLMNNLLENIDDYNRELIETYKE